MLTREDGEMKDSLKIAGSHLSQQIYEGGMVVGQLRGAYRSFSAYFDNL